MSVSARPVSRRPTPMPSVRQAFLAIAAAFGVALVAAYEAIALSAAHIGLVAAMPLGLVAFVLVGAVTLAAAARLDADVFSRW